MTVHHARTHRMHAKQSGVLSLPQISRKPSPHHSVLLYQLLGPADWDIVAVNAMVSKGEAESVRH